MHELHFPWIEVAILLPLFGAALTLRFRGPEGAQKLAIVVGIGSLLAALAAAQDFYLLHILKGSAEDRWHLMTRLFGREPFVVDALSAPLLPLTALIYLLTTLGTMRTKLSRFSFPRSLASQSLTLALFSAVDPWLIIALLIALAIFPYFELRGRGRPTTVYLIHMGAFAALLVVGWSFVEGEGTRTHSLLALLPLLLAVSIRCGVFPFHLWLADLFEGATFGTALLVATPLAGAFAAVRLVVPVAPDWILRALGLTALFTSLYAGAMALVQRDARRFFHCVALSCSTMVLVGMEVVTEVGLTGALCVWISSALSLTGLGLTLRALEAREGRLSLTRYRGLYAQTPALAVSFLVTGLGCVGFPGTMGFVGAEMLIDGAVETYPHVGPALVVAMALTGIAIIRAWFLLFTGTKHMASISLKPGFRERLAVLTLTILILGGGMYPQPSVATRFHAASEVLQARPAADGERDESESRRKSDDDHKPLATMVPRKSVGG